MTDLSSFCADLSSVKRNNFDEESRQEVRFYDVVNSLFTKRSIKAGENISTHGVIKAISMDSSLLMLCARLSKYCRLDRDLLLNILKGILPKRNRGFGFFKYIKMDKPAENILLLLAEHFHVNQKEAEQLLTILEFVGIDLKNIEKFFGVVEVSS